MKMFFKSNTVCWSVGPTQH